MAIPCGRCGGAIILSSRRARVWRDRGQLPICAACRRPKATEAMRRWWLERFSLEEILEMAAAIWPGER